MARTFQDENLMTWEAYASTGEFGFPTDAYVVFHCLTDPSVRARYVPYQGDKSDAEKAVLTMSDEELVELMGKASEMD